MPHAQFFFLNGGQRAQTLIENKVYMLHFPVIFKQSDIIPASVDVSLCKIIVMRSKLEFLRARYSLEVSIRQLVGTLSNGKSNFKKMFCHRVLKQE